LREITDAALPGEDLSEDELSALVDEGTILATPDGAGAVLIVGPGPVREPLAAGSGSGGAAVVGLIAVVPAAQGQGLGRALLRAAEEWAVDHGAAELWAAAAGAAGPWLWPGVDIRATRAVCLFEAAGYQVAGTVLDAACPTTFRASPPPGVTFARVLEDDDADAAVGVGRTVSPVLAGEVARAVEHGSCLLATDEGRPVAVGCHSVNRVGWIGPVLVAGPDRGRGIGAALLAGLCTDLRAAGRPEAQIGWARPLEFYARAAGASVSRVYQRLARGRP
jgi:GNAT superfamily N-acetyltransferase